jgi:DNA-binding NarL/FixJ family response regulator
MKRKPSAPTPSRKVLPARSQTQAGQPFSEVPPAIPAGPQRKCILLVDDHPMTRGGMAAVINKQPDLQVCAEASSAAEALALLAKSSRPPDLVITDITMPGRSGLELIKDLLALHPGLPVLVVTLHDESLYAERALRAGARGYLTKDAGAARLLEAVRHVLSGQTYVSPQLAARIVDLFASRPSRGSSSPIGRLTDREFEVFRLIGEGKTSKQIAQELHLSSKTVDVHRGHIKEKLSIGDVTALVSHAARWIEAQHGGA